MCCISIAITMLLILVWLFLFFFIWCVHYSILGLVFIPYLFPCIFHCRKKQLFFIIIRILVCRVLAWCLKIRDLFADFYPSFPQLSLCSVLPKVTIIASLLSCLVIFFMFMSLFYVIFGRRSCTGKKSQHSQDELRFPHICYQGSSWRSWHPDL